MANRNVTDYLKELVSAAVDEYAEGDPVDWDITMIIQQQAPPVYFVSITIPSPVLGNVHQGGMVLPHWHQISQESISVNVRTALDQLRQARSEALTESLKAAEVDNKSLLLAK